MFYGANQRMRSITRAASKESRSSFSPGSRGTGASAVGLRQKIIVNLCRKVRVHRAEDITVWNARREPFSTQITPLPGSFPRRSTLDVAPLCRLGFTRSIVITLPAFPSSPVPQSEAEIDVLAGSLLAGFSGTLCCAVPVKKSGDQRGPASLANAVKVALREHNVREDRA